MKLLREKDYSIRISWDLYLVLEYMVRKEKDEFTVLTHAEKIVEKGSITYRMYDWFLPEQTNQAAHTEYEPEALFDVYDDGADPGKLSGHMHSHVNFGATPSGTDRDEILERVEAGGFSPSIIMNKDGDIYGHIADYDENIYVEDVDIIVETPIDREQFESELLGMIKTCESLKDVEDVMDFDMLTYCRYQYGAVPDVEKIDSLRKKRFKKVSYKSSKYFGKGKTKGSKRTSTHGNERVLKSNYISIGYYGNAYYDEYDMYDDHDDELEKYDWDEEDDPLDWQGFSKEDYERYGWDMDEYKTQTDRL